MKIWIKEIDGKMKYILPMQELEKIRLENFISIPDFAKKIRISLRSYQRYRDNPITQNVKNAKIIKTFLEQGVNNGWNERRTLWSSFKK